MADVPVSFSKRLDAARVLMLTVDHARRLGIFAQVNGHEPKSAPDRRLSCAMWVADVRAVPVNSGLAITTGLLILNVRVMLDMLHEPQDEIDAKVLGAVDQLFRSYIGDFQWLDRAADELCTVDVLGQCGTPLRAQAGYLTQDKTAFRAYTITLPLIVTDLWEQAA